MEMYRQVLAWAGPGTPHKGAAMAHAGLAHIQCEQNQLDAALEHVKLGTDMLEHVGGAWAAFVLHRVVARVHQIRGNWPDALDTLDRAHQAGRKTQVSLVAKQAAALGAALQLAQGDLKSPETWVAEIGLGPEDPELAQPGWRELEYLTLARIRRAQGDHAQAWTLLKRLLEAADVQGRNGSAIAILIQQALVMQAEGHDDSALEHLGRAVALAEPEGYLRIFVDEGDPMRPLLAELQKRIKRQPGKAVSSTRRSLAYLDRLLLAFSQPIPAAVRGPKGLPERLTEREQEILRLMSEGLSNQEIAASLVVATSTVKSHINHLYGKLGAQRRTQAVSVARELGLLAD
jgi:LuxR family maltose regulon positive regulatory protein